MSNTLLQKSFKSLTCNQPGHQGEPLNYVCICPDCQNSPVMCYLCSIQQHFEHEKIMLNVFLRKLLSIQTKSQNVIPLCAQIDLIFSTILGKLIIFSNQFQNNELIIKTFQQFRSLNVNYALSFYNLTQKLQELFSQNEHHLLIEKLNRIIKNYYYKYFGEIDQKQWIDLDISQNLLKKKIESLNQTLQSLQKLKITHKLNDVQVLNLFPLGSQQFKKIKIYFTDQLKPKHVTLISPTHAKVQLSGSQRLVALEPCLSKNNSVKKWGVKIIKLASWIGVGICHINEIKKANFMFNYTNTGHGNYMISSNGYSWSSYKKQYNSKFEPFSYTTGDVIHLEYDPKLHLLKFKKESDPNQPTYELEIQSNDDPIYPQINLTGAGDEVQIINF